MIRLIQIIKKIFFVTVIALVFCVVSVYAILWIPSVQQKIKDIVLTELMKKTGNRLEIESIRLRPFKSLLLEGVYISDIQEDTMLYASKLSADFSPFELLNNRVQITSVGLDDFKIYVTKGDSASDFNFQFLIDAFVSPDASPKENTGSMTVEIDDVRLRNGVLSYDVLSEKRIENGFDFNHMHLRDLSAEVDLKSLDPEKLNVAVRSLAFREDSGFEVTHLSGKITSGDKKIKLTELKLQLPGSELLINEALADYTGMGIGQLADSAAYSVEIEIPQLDPKDLGAFYIPARNADDTLSLKALISGKLPGINIQTLSGRYGKHVLLDMKGGIQDYIHWADSPLNLTVSQLSTDAKGIGKILLLTGNKVMPSLPVGSAPVSLTGDLTGSLSGMALHLQSGSRLGHIQLTGKGGYEMKDGSSGFDVELRSTDFNLRAFLDGNPSFGRLSTWVQAKGKVSGNGQIDARAHMNINRFDFNDHAYRRIQADVRYLNDSISLYAVSNDSLLPLELNGFYNMRPKMPVSGLYARLKGVQLKGFNGLNLTGDTYLSAVVDAHVQGIDPEKMQAQVRFDSIRLEMPDNRVVMDDILLDYNATTGNNKEFLIQSEIINGTLQGQFVLSRVPETLTNALALYLPEWFTPARNWKKSADHLDLSFELGNTENITPVLGLPFVNIQPGKITAGYDEATDRLSLQAELQKARINDIYLKDLDMTLDTDTILHKMALDLSGERLYETKDTMAVNLHAEAGADTMGVRVGFLNQTPALRLEGGVAASVRVEAVEKQALPDIFVQFVPTEIRMNEKNFRIEPAKLAIRKDRYTIQDFKVSLTDEEYLQIDGNISSLEEDTLYADFSHIHIETLMEALRYDWGVKGEANGIIVANQLLQSPRIFTKGFSINDIRFQEKEIGDLTLFSGWNDQNQGVFFQCDLSQANERNSKVTGYALPGKDSLFVTADIQAIQLDWLSPVTDEFLYGLKGELGANIRAAGKMSRPDLSGSVYTKDASFGLKMTGVTYHLSDSISVTPSSFNFRNFVVKDDLGHQAVFTGDVNHTGFSSFKPNVSARFSDFRVLNNPAQKDSLYYGTLRLNGTANITGSDKEMILKMALSNSGKSRVFFRMPEEEYEARRYASITFINPDDSLKNENENVKMPGKEAVSLGIPVKLDIALSLNPQLTVGTVINPQTQDEAYVNGTGNINFKYDLAKGDMSILGDYTVSDGQCRVSLQNIARKVFKVQPGGKVLFNGDPMATSFDVAAIYSLRADLMTLDQSFGEDSYLSSTKVPVNCLIGVSGNIDQMEISYDIVLPNNSENVQSTVGGLLYSDDIKIKEIAYLLALGTFTPVMPDQGRSSGNIWTSLASASLTTQLNNLLSGVMNDNWTIGTDLHTSDNNMSNLEMDVNISTRLFNDRLTLNSNIGYRNTSNSNMNFTGDFDVQYKITKSGDLVLKMYNVTNDRFYEQTQAPTTQGVGVVYKKEAKTFKNLFWRIRNRFKK